MNVSNIGAVCYSRFKRESIVKALSAVAGIPNLKPAGLDSEQLTKAKHRAQSRLGLYYNHLETLLRNIKHPQVEDSLSALRKVAKDDANRLNAAYDEITKSVTDEGEPGIALFLHIGDRTFALLPEGEINSDKVQTDHVYMSPLWSQIIFGMEDKDRGPGSDLRTRITRSNRLWQRERWSVLPGADTAEPSKEKKAAYFNNIMLHQKPVDGWVDAFWGVQSGLRLPIPIGDSADSLLIVLVTNYIPDLFQEWDQEPTRYLKQMPPALATKAIEALRSAFKDELHGLSFVTSLLIDVIDNETNLLNAGMRMLAHYVKGPSANSTREKSPWEKRVVSLVQGLRQISPGLYEKLNDLERPMEAALERLETVSGLLPNDDISDRWRKDLALQKKKGNQQGFTLLPDPKCTVGDLVKALEALQDSQQSIISRAEDLDKYIDREINRSLIHPYLLTAILENLLSKKNVYITISIKDDPERDRRKVIQLTAFYPIWNLNLQDEKDFLLRPLAPEPPRQHHRNQQPGPPRKGFYLTAQVLWRVDGLIEYYPLSAHSETTRSALVNLTIPL